MCIEQAENTLDIDACRVDWL